MYLAKIRKQLERQDIEELEDKLEAILESTTLSSAPTTSGASSGFTDTTSKNKDTSQKDFIENLPSSSCYRPAPLIHPEKMKEDQVAIRPAEYIGSFSVKGSDQKARVEFAQKQLQSMRFGAKTKRVTLIISMTGIKVCSLDGNTVYMAHSLKRISYATSDPENCLFSFMAREPHGEMDLQYCHAFVTKTPEKAEELNAIIGNAFKMAYAKERAKTPTFNELIAQQVTEQQAHFRAIEEQAQQLLQEKLTAIARPTPLSKKALQRMEIRKQSITEETSSASDKDKEIEAIKDQDLIVGKKKIWAKQSAENVKHRFTGSTTEQAPESSAKTSSSSSTSTPNSSRISANKSKSHPSKKVKMKMNLNNSAVMSQYHPLSAAAIRESLENSNNSNKFKGSPVTALKDEIDRHFMCNGTEPIATDIFLPPSKGRQLSQSPHRGVDHHHSQSPDRYGRQEMEPPVHGYNPMANRPLPAVPLTHADLLRSPAHRAVFQNRRSLDDHNLSPTSNSRNLANGESPRHRPQRPMSAIVSSGTLYDNPANGQPYRLGEEDCAGQYVYGPNAHQGVYRQSRSPNRKKNWPSSMESENEPEHIVLRYQNASPFQAEKFYDVEKSEKSKPGLESLMCLDRSHIEDESLRHAPWYQAGIPREIALEILQQEEVGSFIVRDSTTHPGCFALSVRVPKFENANGISHYLILKTQRGVKLKGLDKEWSSLTALVTHHTVMREMLPCTLKLPRKAKNPTFKASDKDDREEDPDYQRLSDFSTMMAQLKM